MLVVQLAFPLVTRAPEFSKLVLVLFFVLVPSSIFFHCLAKPNVSCLADSISSVVGIFSKRDEPTSRAAFEIKEKKTKEGTDDSVTRARAGDQIASACSQRKLWGVLNPYMPKPREHYTACIFRKRSIIGINTLRKAAIRCSGPIVAIPESEPRKAPRLPRERQPEKST
ncbi:hypothetical protein CI238_01236 [Colletotrichum incanum]|uniref:Uncharacterized protein n=1 Tax=Colletotrichum incanum TaxID=1573173 RepID=A0A161VQ89_COLIC|nr:hypothetical protein CI238_01236 [Colletotrichum incanum]